MMNKSEPWDTYYDRELLGPPKTHVLLELTSIKTLSAPVRDLLCEGKPETILYGDELDFQWKFTDEGNRKLMRFRIMCTDWNSGNSWSLAQYKRVGCRWADVWYFDIAPEPWLHEPSVYDCWRHVYWSKDWEQMCVDQTQRKPTDFVKEGMMILTLEGNTCKSGEDWIQLWTRQYHWLHDPELEAKRSTTFIGNVVASGKNMCTLQ